MADYRLQGPTNSWDQSLRTDNGCLTRQPCGARGPIERAVAGHASEWDPFVIARRAFALFQAYQIGCTRAPAAIAQATGLDDLPKLSKTVLSGMLQMALVVAATTAIGGAAGAAIGALFAGVGAVPGAAAGAQIGFDAGMAVLAWMGLAVIAVEVVRGLGEVTNLLQRAVVTAWNAEDAPQRQQQIDAAGQMLADAMGQLMLLVLLAIVARLAAGQAVASTGRAAAASSELITTLRRSQLGAEFAAWVEANAERLMRNPKLRAQNETSGSSARGSDTATPSRLKNSAPKPSETDAPVSASPAPATKTPVKSPPQALPPLRQAYVDAVSELKALAAQMRNEGMNTEQIARTLHGRRRAIGEQYKALTPPDKLAEIYARNERVYGDKLGPPIDWLRAKGKSWEQIIESATRTGGKDLGF